MKLGLMAIASGNPLEHVLQHQLLTRQADFGPFTPAGEITVLSDQIVMLITAGVLLALFLPALVRRRAGSDEVGRLVPTGAANLVEAVCQYLRKEVAEPSLHEHADRFIKFLWTLFFFLLTVNLLGMIPFGAVSTLFGTHIGGTATANIWVTGALAVMTLLTWIVNGFRLGGKHYLAHFNPGPWWLAPLLVPLEIFGLFAKTFALAVRLFANMVAGHVVLAVLLSFIIGVGTAVGVVAGFGVAVPVVLGSVAISLLEIFVALLQAFIFTFLAALFLGMSVVFHHHDEEAGVGAH